LYVIMSTVKVVRTYLEMTSPGQLDPARVSDPLPSIEQLEQPTVALFRFLYQEVGRAYHWTDRLGWTDSMIREYLADPTVSLWVMSSEGEAAGYFELRKHGDGSVEIAYFGLLPDFIGRGWGKYLLTRAVEAAWGLGPNRVWLHTCTLDHPAALPNYLKRGFRPFRQEEYLVSGEEGKRGGGEVRKQ
jgi:GNAT superfamily N-acetyltransferase